ncbi:MAG: DUF5723 family protein [Crocinitomicaceae bacterium]|nr:DUF5723 family protein [Crocinitomicaceae bacterium]
MNKSITLIPFLIFILLANSFKSQNYLGIHSSNYAGVMGTDLQPASFVDSRFLFDLNLGSVNFTTYQNFGAFDAGVLPKWWKGSLADQQTVDSWVGQPDSTIESNFFGGYSFLPKYYNVDSKGTLGLYSGTQVDLLNFMFHINPKIAVGFTAKVRSITNIDNIDPKLAVLAEEELEYPDLWNLVLNEELLNVNHLTWAEYGINYSQVVMDKDKHFLKAGGKLKYLAGYTAAYMHTGNFEYNLFNSDTSQYLSGDFSYGYSSNIDEMATNTYTFDGPFGLPKQASSAGFGVDLGVVYEYRPDFMKYKYDMDGETNLWYRDKDKYKFRVGASLLDLGGMRFTKGGLSRDFSVNTSDYFDLNTFDNANSLLEFDQIIDSLVQNQPGWSSSEDTASTFYIRTPSAFSFQFDYHIWNWIYVNATGYFNIISKKKAAKVKMPNQFSITPSFDFAWFGLHLPISMNEYSGFKAGVATRLGPLTVGITDFRPLFATGENRGVEFYTGIRVPVLYDRPNDMDGDKISDKKDECKDVPGIAAFHGCPDTDKDGISDQEDDCPEIPGLKEFRGCPDTDGDKIIDQNDSCPEIAGLKEFNGCPDRDGDKIMDKNDSCPDVAGLKEFDGCPDRDGDKVIDKNDSCPDVAGLKELNGCPKSEEKQNEIVKVDKDTDGDGLLDKDDDCVTVPGPKENNGCPYKDTDGDGLLDKDDDCVTIPGPKENNGCPYKDTDGDGLLDKDDDCPKTAGPKENKGCPIIEEEVKEILKEAFDNLEFELAKSIIRNESLPSLTELAEVLIKRPEWILHISGHTDSKGDAAANMKLSKRRAEAVRDFLASKGVKKSNMKVFYFGETKPIASNKTAEGRSHNRRVEFEIKHD